MLALDEAFEAALETPLVTASPVYLSLYINMPYYGGPEEGGWWGWDTQLVQYRRYPCEELAAEDLASIERLAATATTESTLEWGRHCQRECDQAEARGIESADLPETDGAADYFVQIENDLGSAEKRGCRHYQ